MVTCCARVQLIRARSLGARLGPHRTPCRHSRQLFGRIRSFLQRDTGHPRLGLHHFHRRLVVVSNFQGVVLAAINRQQL